MKYIRTKDGKIVCPQLIDEKYEKQGDTYGMTEDESFWISSFHNPKHHKLGLERRILKQADTIDKLCDGYIVEHIDGTICCVIAKTFDGAKEMIKIDEPCYIYGFIKTDKGLIFVAKMNDKGELELL